MVKINSCIHFHPGLSWDGCVRASDGCPHPFFLLYTFRPLLLGQWGNLPCRRGSAVKSNSSVARYYAIKAAEVYSNETHCKRISSLVSYSTNKGWGDVFAEFVNLLMNTCTLFHQPTCSHCLVNGLCTWSCITFLRIREPSSIKTNINLAFCSVAARFLYKSVVCGI